MKWNPLCLALGLGALTLPGVSHADHHEGHDVSRKMTLPAGEFLVTGQLDINLSKDLSLEPITIAPDVWYGASQDLSIGLVHSSQSRAGFFGGPGGICLDIDGSDAPDPDSCPDAYGNLGLLARYDLNMGDTALAVDGGLLINSLDPFTMGLKLGVAGGTRLGPVDLMFAPNIYVGVTERDLGNKEVLSVPVSVLYPASDVVSLGLQTGVVLPFDGAGDNWRMPVGLLGNFLISEKYYAFGSFMLPGVVGGDAAKTEFDARVLTLGGGATF